MVIRQLEFKEETIQTLTHIKKLMSEEWLKQRVEVDRIICRVRATSFCASKIQVNT